VYPVKACRGISVAQWPVVARGFDADRRWMIVDETGTFVTQREVSRLALVNAALEGESLRIDAAGLTPLVVPRSYEAGAARKVRIWQDESLGCTHPEGSAWFSEFLGAPHELVYMPETHHRQVNPRLAHPGDIVSFADGYPFLLISEASLEDLNGRMAKAIPMVRFRPNIVISGTTAFAEDEFGHVRIGEISFRGVKHCDRCVVTTIDIQTAERSKEPLRTLASFRLWDSKVWFGMNMIHDGPGLLRVGDRVQV
jgi:uncharacterized protein